MTIDREVRKEDNVNQMERVCQATKIWKVFFIKQESLQILKRVCDVG